MTRQFEGIVINPGSPNDGKKKSSKTSFLRLNETPQATAQPIGDGTAPHTGRMKTADYVFVPIHTENGGRWGFWLPDGRDVSWMIDTLITEYRRARK